MHDPTETQTQALASPRRRYIRELYDLEKLCAALITEKSLSLVQGRHRERFGFTSGTRLNVEIGCNAGHVLLALAERAPHELFLGVDWKHKQIFRGCEKIQKRGLKNAGFVRANANDLTKLFAPDEIDTLSIFFPDPWPKRVHHKHRLLTAAWLNKVAPLVRSGGTLEIRTDDLAYAAWIDREIRGSSAWKLLHYEPNRHGAHPAPETLTIPDVTLFERIFIHAKKPIHRFMLAHEQSPVG